MEAISSGPFVQIKEWTFDSAKKALEHKPYKTLQSALYTLAILGAVISGALTLGDLMQFSAVPLKPTAVALIAVAVLKYIVYKLDQSAEEGLVKQGLTRQRQTELLAARFKELITTATEGDVEFIKKMENDIGVYSPFYDLLQLQVRFNPYQDEIAQFSVHNDGLSEKVVDDLLFTAYSKGVILHLTTLEQSFMSFKPLEIYATPTYKAVVKKWENAGLHYRVVPEANRSAIISTRFVMNCFKTGKVQVDKMNQQLNALGFKYIDTEPNHEARAVKPAVFMEDEETLILRSIFGEVGDLKKFFTLLNLNESRGQGHSLKKIKIQGDGFYISQRDEFLSLEEYEAEKTPFEKKIKAKNHGVEIIFEKIERPYHAVFWQEGTPRSTFITTNVDEKPVRHVT